MRAGCFYFCRSPPRFYTRTHMIEFRDVPYGLDSFIPGTEVELTFEEALLRNLGEDPDKPVLNRNAAGLLGLSVKVKSGWSGTGEFDTLAVALDASSVDPAATVLRFGENAEG